MSPEETGGSGRSGHAGRDRLSRAEIGKDVVQDTAVAAAGVVGEVGTILTGAVRDMARALGGFATEMFEIRESAQRAAAEHSDRSGPDGPAEVIDVVAVEVHDDDTR